MITTFFPFDANPDRLERLARAHAEELDLVYGSDSSATPVHRLIVNYLRHECTDYDLDQSRARHRAACEVIGRRFPWLAQECDRQIARRAAQEAEEEGYRQALAEQEHALREERRALVARSREAIKGMRVGQRVHLKLGRHRYIGVIIKLGRSRATVAYQIATGRDRDRERLMHAALLTPVEEGEGSRQVSPGRWPSRLGESRFRHHHESGRAVGRSSSRRLRSVGRPRAGVARTRPSTCGVTGAGSLRPRVG